MADTPQSHTSDSGTSSPGSLRWSLLQGTSPWMPWSSAPHPPPWITTPSSEFQPWKNSVTPPKVYNAGIHFQVGALFIRRFVSLGFDTNGLTAAVWPGGETEGLARLKQMKEVQISLIVFAPSSAICMMHHLPLLVVLICKDCISNHFKTLIML